VAIKWVGSRLIDSNYNEDAWANPQSWIFDAKATPKSGSMTPAQPLDTALYRMGCSCSVIRARTFYSAGSTVFPSDSGDRRIWVKVDVYIEFVRPEAFFLTVDLNDFDWQVVRVS
jgi:hypothetical protein